MVISLFVGKNLRNSMERFIKIPKDPFGEGFDICTKDGITFQEGVTVLVGCNGSGKTTTLRCIEEQLKRDNIPYLNHDNNGSNDKHNIMEKAAFEENFALLSSAFVASEGENITISLGESAKLIYKFLKTGHGNRYRSFFNEDDRKAQEESKERWILFDAVDSGYSIDNIIVFKDLLNIILENSKELSLNTFIIITANSYEMTIGLPCIDVYTGNIVEFGSYQDYKSYILETSDRKEKRYEEKDED